MQVGGTGSSVFWQFESERRKPWVKHIVTAGASQLLCVHDVEEQRGIDLFRLACERDLEGIIASGATACINAPPMADNRRIVTYSFAQRLVQFSLLTIMYGPPRDCKRSSWAKKQSA